MDVRLSPEQQDLAASAARLVDRLGPHAVGEIDDRQRAGALDAAVTSAGWRELRTDDGQGRPWATGVEAGIVAEELGRGLADVSFLGPTLGSELRRLAGAPPAVDVETVVLTDVLSSLALSRDDALAGVAIDVQGASHALLLVSGTDGYQLARTGIGGRGSGVDLTRPSARLEPAAEVTPVDGGRPLTADDLARWTALGLSLACADLVGIMEGAVRLSTSYAAERIQYGAPIGSFQAVQHLLADAFVQAEGSRSITRHATWAVDALAPSEAVAAATVAKAYCARASRAVCETAIQVHGGIGNTWDCLAHVFLRRALLSGDLLGDIGVSLGRVLQHHGMGGGDGLS
jgi:alkylation response protein AidB-like acyl-CoA dehydrogenase